MVAFIQSISFVSDLVNLGVLALAGVFIISGEITVGVYTAFSIYINRKAAGGAKLPPAAIITFVAVSPLAHDFSEHLKLFIIIALYDQHHILSHHEVGVIMLVRVVAHTDRTVRKIAEHAATILTGDHS